MSILNLTFDQIPEPPEPFVPKPKPEWRHPTSEADRLNELKDFLSADFHTYQEVRISQQSFNGRIDLLAIPKATELNGVALAFEVKSDRFDLERALKQSADYVGGRVLVGPHCWLRNSTCWSTKRLRLKLNLQQRST